MILDMRRYVFAPVVDGEVRLLVYNDRELLRTLEFNTVREAHEMCAIESALGRAEICVREVHPTKECECSECRNG